MKSACYSAATTEKTLHLAIAEQRLGIPDHLEIVTGGEDEIVTQHWRGKWKQLGINVSILPNEGHMLEPASVEGALQRFLPMGGNHL